MLEKEKSRCLATAFALCISNFIMQMACKGNHYQIMYFRHGRPSNPPEYMYIVINNESQIANVTTYITGFPNATSNALVGRNGGFYLGNLTSHMLLSDNSHAISLRSDVDITVIARNSRSYALDAYLVIPVSYSAFEFYVTPYCSQNTSSPSECFVGLMPTSSDIEVTFVMPGNKVTLTSGYISGRKSFDAYEAVSEQLFFEDIKILQGNDLVGMKLSANCPVNVFVGNTLGTFYKGSNTDFTEEQLMPVNRWGLSYVVARSSKTDDRVWIIASTADTNIKVVSSSHSCEQYSITKAGEVLDFLVVDTSYYIVANKPIGITHFVLRGKGLIYTMYRMTPIEQFVSGAVTFVPEPSVTGDGSIKYAATVIFTQTNMTSSLKLDGKYLSNATEWEEIPFSGMSVTSIQMTTQQTHVFQQQGSGGVLGGYVFGYDKYAVFAHALTLSYRDMESECDGPCYDTSIYDKLSCQSNACVSASQPECASIQLPGSNSYTHGRYYICSACSDKVNTTETEKQTFDQMINEMTVNKKTSSKYRRRKSSADDIRGSSAAIGVIFSCIALSMVGLFIYQDIIQVFTFILSVFQTLSK